MTAAFIHDHNFVYNSADGLYYDGSGGVFDAHMWSRYLSVFKRLKVVGRRQDSLPNRLVVASAPNVRFNLIHNVPRGVKRYLGAPSVVSQIERELTDVDAAIIRVPSTLGYMAQQVCIENHIPYLLEIVGCAWDAYWNYGSFFGRVLAPIEMFKLKQACRRANNCIYVTETFLQSRYPTRGKHINVSNVMIKEVLNYNKTKEFYSDYLQPSINSRKLIIGLIGTFHVKYKGHVEALKAVRYLLDRQEIGDLELRLVGTGDSSWLKSLINKLRLERFVKVIGTLEAGEKGIYPFLDTLHLYIHPSKQEGLPRAVIEAMARGRVCLGASTAGIPELLSSEYLHNPGDWKTLAHQISNLYEAPERWTSIGLENTKKAEMYLEDTLQQRRSHFLTEIFINRI